MFVVESADIETYYRKNTEEVNRRLPEGVKLLEAYKIESLYEDTCLTAIAYLMEKEGKRFIYLESCSPDFAEEKLCVYIGDYPIVRETDRETDLALFYVNAFRFVREVK